MGDAGQIWFTDVGNENGEYELKIIGIYTMFEE